MESYLLDIERCSVHDGPGIRTTVFFKGCPLKCKWCHNPESQSFEPQLSFIKARCLNCGQCESICPYGNHSIKGKQHFIEYKDCKLCQKCVQQCPTKALEIKGQPFDLKAVMAIILQDISYYKKSGGGVTLSGGEVLSHPKAARELLKACKQKRIHTCIETSGIGSKEAFDQIIDDVDLVLYDYKHTNEAQHKVYTGVGNQKVFEHLAYLQQKGKKVILRCPIIPEVNDTKAHFEGIINTFRAYSVIQEIEILPYHNTGISKAMSVGEEQCRFKTPTQEQVQEWKKYCLTSKKA